MQITKEMNVYELLDKFPQLEKLFEDYGLTCIGCPGAEMESISEAANSHGINLEDLLKDINKEIEK